VTASAIATTPARTITARNAVAIVFSLNGLAIASWLARIPAAKQSLDLSAGHLGLLLLAMSGGAVLALSTAGTVADRWGTPWATAAGTVLVSAGLVVIGLGTSVVSAVPVVAVGLFILGYGSGTCEVALNIEGAMVERHLGWTVMPRFHAGWSIGTVVGAGLGALSSRAGLPVAVHLSLIAALTLAGTLVGVRSFLPDPVAPTAPTAPTAETISAAPSRPATGGVLAAWLEPRTLLIGLLALAVAFTEGTANDWLAVGFVDGYQVSNAAGAAVFGLFVAAMTTGRTIGTIALDRWGRVRVLLVTMLLAAAGATLVVFASTLPLGLLGVLLWGLGASLGFPVSMSAAADDESRAPARVSVVAMLGYTAFLAGPPLVGLLGNHIGVLRALLVVPVLLIPALALVPIARPPAPAPVPEAVA
jgi:MFS family permease